MITDEIYEHLVYGDARHVSMPVVVPELRDRCVIVNGVAKTYAMTGWRVGWAIAPQPVSRGAGPHPEPHDLQRVQRGAGRGRGRGVRPARRRREMRDAYDRRRLIAHAALSAIDGITCPLPDGAFYVFPRRARRPGPHDRRPPGRRRRASWPRRCSTASASRWSPAPASAPPAASASPTRCPTRTSPAAWTASRRPSPPDRAQGAWTTLSPDAGRGAAEGGAAVRSGCRCACRTGRTRRAVAETPAPLQGARP